MDGVAVRAIEAVRAMGEGEAAVTEALEGLNEGAVGRNSRALALNLLDTAEVGVSVPRGLERPELT